MIDATANSSPCLLAAIFIPSGYLQLDEHLTAALPLVACAELAVLCASLSLQEEITLRVIDSTNTNIHVLTLLDCLKTRVEKPRDAYDRCFCTLDSVLGAFAERNFINGPADQWSDDKVPKAQMMGAVMKCIVKTFPELLDSDEKSAWWTKIEQRNTYTHQFAADFSPEPNASLKYITFIAYSVMPKLCDVDETGPSAYNQLINKIKGIESGQSHGTGFGNLMFWMNLFDVDYRQR